MPGEESEEKIPGRNPRLSLGWVTKIDLRYFQTVKISPMIGTAALKSHREPIVKNIEEYMTLLRMVPI